MIIIRTMDGKKKELCVDRIRELIAYEGLLVSSQVRFPFEAIIYYHNALLPVLGPLPKTWDSSASEDERPWLLVFTDHAQVVLGLPEFSVEPARAKEKKVA